MKRKHFSAAIIISLVIVIILVMLNDRSIMIGYCKNRRLYEFRKISEIGPQQDQEPHIERFEKYQKKLVELKYFSYEKMPLKHVKVPSENNKGLFLDLNSSTSIENGYFQIGGYGEAADEIEIWGTVDQIEIMKKIIAQHEAQAAIIEPNNK